MKKIIILLLFFNFFIIACTTSFKSKPIKYHSEKLCNGVRNLTEYFEKSQKLKSFFKDVLTDTINLRYKIEEYISEGIPLPFFQKEVSAILMEKDGLTYEEAKKRLMNKFEIKEIIRLDIGCMKKNKLILPEIKVKFWYYPEFAILIADIEQVNYFQGYSKGFLFFSQLGANGELNDIKTSFWNS
jgi:hypothetical protein